MNSHEEHWVALKDHPNYAVSSWGRVLNMRLDRELNPCTNNAGYKQVTLYDNNVGDTAYIHRLVASIFHPEYDEDLEIKHANGFKNDNAIGNLQVGPEKVKKSRSWR